MSIIGYGGYSPVTNDVIITKDFTQFPPGIKPDSNIYVVNNYSNVISFPAVDSASSNDRIWVVLTAKPLTTGYIALTGFKIATGNGTEVALVEIYVADKSVTDTIFTENLILSQNKILSVNGDANSIAAKWSFISDGVLTEPTAPLPENVCFWAGSDGLLTSYPVIFNPTPAYTVTAGVNSVVIAIDGNGTFDATTLLHVNLEWTEFKI